MSYFEFPLTRTYSDDLGWLIRKLKKVEDIALTKSLKYADPIQWNITSQYELNTIVIDPISGVAYMSVQAVPSGISLTDTDYWTPVFDLGRFVTKMAKNLANIVEAETTLTATVPSSLNDWLIWGDSLYKVINPSGIIVGDRYVVDSNIKLFTIEDVIGHIEDLSTTDKTNLVAAINELLATLIGTTGDLNDLSTVDKTNLVAAINELLATLIGTVGDLADLSTTDKTNLVAAINEVINNLLTTDAKLDKFIDDSFYVTPEMYGAIGDGVNDDTQAIQGAIDSGHGVFFSKEKSYLCLDTINITNRVNMYGNGASLILNDSTEGISVNIAAGLKQDAYMGIFDNFVLKGSAPLFLHIKNATKSTISNVYFDHFDGIGLQIEFDCYEMQFENMRFFGNAAATVAIKTYSNDDVFENLYFCDCHVAVETHCGANFFNSVHGWILTPTFLSGSILFDSYDWGYFHPNYYNNIYNDTYQYGFYIRSYQFFIISNFYNLINWDIWTGAGDPTGYVIYYDDTSDYGDFTFRLMCKGLRVSGKSELQFSNVPASKMHAQLEWLGAENVYLTDYTSYFNDEWKIEASAGTTITENHIYRYGNEIVINAVVYNTNVGYTPLFELPYWLKQYIKDNLYIPCDVSDKQYDNDGNMERCYGYMGTNGIYTAQMKTDRPWVFINMTLPVNFIGQ